MLQVRVSNSPGELGDTEMEGWVGAVFCTVTLLEVSVLPLSKASTAVAVQVIASPLEWCDEPSVLPVWPEIVLPFRLHEYW